MFKKTSHMKILLSKVVDTLYRNRDFKTVHIERSFINTIYYPR